MTHSVAKVGRGPRNAVQSAAAAVAAVVRNMLAVAAVDAAVVVDIAFLELNSYIRWGSDATKGHLEYWQQYTASAAAEYAAQCPNEDSAGVLRQCLVG